MLPFSSCWFESPSLWISIIKGTTEMMVSIYGFYVYCLMRELFSHANVAQPPEKFFRYTPSSLRQALHALANASWMQSASVGYNLQWFFQPRFGLLNGDWLRIVNINLADSKYYPWLHVEKAHKQISLEITVIDHGTEIEISLSRPERVNNII